MFESIGAAFLGLKDLVFFPFFWLLPLPDFLGELTTFFLGDLAVLELIKVVISKNYSCP